MVGKNKLQHERDSRCVLLTPELAQKWLDNMRANRPRVKGLAERYARDMSSGRWRWCGDTVRFNEDGQMIDGQHRSLAVVLSGVSIEVMVVKDIPDERFHLIDRNTPRSTATIWRLQDESYAVLKSAVCKMLLKFKESDGQAIAPCPYTIDEEEGALKTYRNRIEAAIDELPYIKGHKVSIGGGGTFWAFLHVVLASIDKEEATTFVSSIMTGEMLPRSSAAYLLRDQLLTAKANRRSMPRWELLGKSLKAWNSLRAHKPLRVVRFGKGEEVPRPV